MMRGPSILLMGPPGSGKTHSLVTIMEHGYDLFLIITEPNGLETLLDAMRKREVDQNRLHYAVIEPARVGFDTLEDMARKVTIMSFDGLAKLGPTHRADAAFLKVVAACKNFTDERTGVAYGNIAKLYPSCVVAIDSLSGLSLMAMDLTIGDKVTAHQGEWGVAMNILERLINNLTSNLICPFVLTAHLEPERDEITGGVKLMVSTLGRKLAPKIPRFFSEVVLTRTEGTSYYWSTTHPQMDLKHRSLGHAANLAPNFSPILKAYETRLEQVKPDPIQPLTPTPLQIQGTKQ